VGKLFEPFAFLLHLLFDEEVGFLDPFWFERKFWKHTAVWC
jgi:hypothetical protein